MDMLKPSRNSTHFIENRQISFSDCDRNKNLKLSAILRLTGEHAGRELEADGISHQWLWEHGMVFLLTRISVRINRIPREKEWLEHHTWVHSVKGAQFLRAFAMLDENGERYLDCMSGWVLVNPATRQILRPKEYPHPFTLDESDPPQAPMPGRIELVHPVRAGERPIRYSDIDPNGHCYNAVYADIICDFAPPKALEAIENGAKGFRINFIHEAVCGDTLAVYREELPGECRFAGEIDGHRCFEAAIEW